MLFFHSSVVIYIHFCTYIDYMSFDLKIEGCCASHLLVGATSRSRLLVVRKTHYHKRYAVTTLLQIELSSPKCIIFDWNEYSLASIQSSTIPSFQSPACDG